MKRNYLSGKKRISAQKLTNGHLRRHHRQRECAHHFGHLTFFLLHCYFTRGLNVPAINTDCFTSHAAIPDLLARVCVTGGHLRFLKAG